jgi:hypothetical protein
MTKRAIKLVKPIAVSATISNTGDMGVWTRQNLRKLVKSAWSPRILEVVEAKSNLRMCDSRS